MLAFVPVAFDLYRPLKPRLRWAMQCLVSFADGTGRCFPSIRKFARHAGISKSAAGRDLAELAVAGHITRKRRPGGVYIYRIDPRFLPQWPKRKVSQAKDRQIVVASDQRSHRSAGSVPTQGTKENPDKKNQGWTRKRARFTKPGLSYGELSDETAKWRLRLRSWHKSRFWLPLWGPKPIEPGCMAPPTLLQIAI
jgi:DNA-binding transcriptional MocR family regulator